MVEVRWHQQEANDVLKALDSSSEGLSQKRAEQRLQAQGPNALPNPSEHSLASIVIGQFTDVLILVLLAAALISGFIGDLTDTVAILVIVLFNAIIGSVQGYRAERAVAALKKMAEPSARALRDGALITVPTTALVPGDIVAIDVGNSIPADLRLLETEDLQINESTLTGESQPVSKQSSPLGEPQLPLGDINNCAFKGSHCLTVS
ncbi:MAG TPA: ATPase, partial [Gammaproteobacteria bacterium]|nr:ATPase [Gammaproteobacteria bacterium]